MNLEDDLRDQFGQAEADVVLPPASVAAVKRRARQRTHRTRLGASAAALSVVAIVGTVIQSQLDRSTEQIQTVENAPASQVDELENPVEESVNGVEESGDQEGKPVDSVDESADNVDELVHNADESADTVDEGVGADQPPADGEVSSDQSQLEDGPTDEPEPTTTETRQVLTEADLSYVGAFRAPADVGDPGFGFGGRASAFNPGGDPGSSDGYDGSLFLSGLAGNDLVAEISIPAPVPFTGDVGELPVATVLQPLADVTGGRGAEYVGSGSRGGLNDFRIGGLEVVDGPNGSRLHWTAWQYFNVGYNDVAGHGHSSLDLSNPDPQGPWYLEQFPTYRTAGYVLSVPDEFAFNYLSGRSLLVGFQAGRPTAVTSGGPPFFAVEPPLTATPEARIEAQELAGYANPGGDATSGSGPEQALPGYREQGLTPGAAWLVGPDGSQAIVTAGNQLAIESNCDVDDGSDRSRFGPQISFYDPADLAAVAEGRSEPWQVKPFGVWDPSQYLVPACGLQLSSLSFDPNAGRLFLVQVQADTDQREFEPVPVVHVFEVR